MKDEIRIPALRSIRPGRLRGLNDEQIERALERLFNCTVEYENGVARIYCVESYENPKLLQKHAAQRLGNVGRVSFACQNGRAFVRLEFNEIARSVMAGESNALHTEE